MFIKYETMGPHKWAVKRDQMKVGEVTGNMKDKEAHFLPVPERSFSREEMTSIANFMITASGRVYLSDMHGE
jgi:hypothetical protein